MSTIDALVTSGDQACLSSASLSLERAAAKGNIGRVGARFAKRMALISEVLYHILNVVYLLRPFTLLRSQFKALFWSRIML